MQIRDHQLAGVRSCPSPNHDARPLDAAIELVVVHGISLPPGCFGARDVESLFCNAIDPCAHAGYGELAGMRVSSHVLIHRTGACVQFVPFHLRAWHAGVSAWGGRAGCNDFSIGIELEGADDVPYADAQYAVLARVLRALLDAYASLAIDAIVGHSDIAPGRKTDPGPAFDWPRLRRGLA